MATGMSQAEIEEFLDGARTLIFVTTKKDGAPVAHPLWFSRVGGHLYVNIRTDSLKWKNVQRDDRVCCVAEAGESYFALRGVMIQGRATPVEDEAELERELAAREAKAGRIGSGMEEMPGWFQQSRDRRRSRGDRVMLRISMDKVFSWDFGQTREHYRRAGG
jgi:nitroimidazol reductase NimA-like FMN-containing flavoprotein (pyridoxamine 5'-phosphate oxidase superfamily)